MTFEFHHSKKEKKSFDIYDAAKEYFGLPEVFESHQEDFFELLKRYKKDILKFKELGLTFFDYLNNDSICYNSFVLETDLIDAPKGTILTPIRGRGPKILSGSLIMNKYKRYLLQDFNEFIVSNNQEEEDELSELNQSDLIDTTTERRLAEMRFYEFLGFILQLQESIASEYVFERLNSDS